MENKKEIYIDKISDEELTKEIFTNGDIWYTNSKNQFHRIDGPALDRDDGTKEYYIKGKLHRTDGPAYNGADGSKAWYQNDKLHRLDGPAIERDDGTKEYYIKGKQYTELEFNIYMRKMKMENL